MTFTVTWDDEAQTIMSYNVGRGWTWQGFRDIKIKGDAMIDQAAHSNPVGIMCILPHDFHVPPNAILNTRSAIIDRHPRAQVLIVVTGNNHLKSLYDVLVKVYPPTAEICLLTETVEKARAEIHKRLTMLSQQQRV